MKNVSGLNCSWSFSGSADSSDENLKKKKRKNVVEIDGEFKVFGNFFNRLHR